MESITKARDEFSGPGRGKARPWARVAACGVLVSAALVLGLLAWRNPGQVHGLPPCPTWWLGGVYCPGCGGMRALHYLLTGQIGLAWRHNPMMVALGVPIGVVFAAGLAGVVVRGRWWWVLGVDGVLGVRLVRWGLVVLVVGFGIVRNVPVGLLAPLRPPAPAWTLPGK